MQICLRALCLFSFVFVCQFVYADNDQFTVTQIVTTDTATPTVPTLLSVAPVTISQINLTWSSSTDDVAVGGYQVFRDASAIATTTLLTLSDTGLSASTTYTYTVRAFDTSSKYSDLSAAVATTTSALVVATSSPTSTAGSNGGNSRPELVSFVVDVNVTTASFVWETDSYTSFSLRWGTNSNYESGYVISDIYAHEHQTLLDSLNPDTKYEYELVAYDRRGNDYLLERSSFTTLEDVSYLQPENVTGVVTTILGSDVHLGWNNPTSDTFSYVRVVRNPQFYPRDEADGYVVYQGDDESVFDRGVIEGQSPQYYSIFVYDIYGNISSGSVFLVVASNVGDYVLIESSSGIESNNNGDNAESPLPDRQNEEVDKVIAPSFSFSDVNVIQNGRQVDLRAEDVGIRAGTPFKVSLPYQAVPQHLKTIIVTVTDSRTDASYLLRRNTTGNAYEAVIGAITRPGQYEMHVQVFDYETQETSSVYGQLRVELPPGVQGEEGHYYNSTTTTPTPAGKIALYLSSSLLFLIIFCTLLYKMMRM